MEEVASESDIYLDVETEEEAAQAEEGAEPAGGTNSKDSDAAAQGSQMKGKVYETDPACAKVVPTSAPGAGAGAGAGAGWAYVCVYVRMHVCAYVCM